MDFLCIYLVPTGPPRNCRATSILSRSFTLSWDMPVRSSQNGNILRYNITCYINDVLSVSVTSVQTTLSLSGLTPFTEYICKIAAINVVGQGPTINGCAFKTSEDGMIILINDLING